MADTEVDPLWCGAGICLDGRTDLHVIDRGALTALRYQDKALHPIVRTFAGVVGPGFILMQDNA